MKTNSPVDFANPTDLEAELAAAPEKKEKAPKVVKPRIIKVSYVAQKDIAAGEVIEFDYELPKSAGSRGQVQGIPLTEMTDDQLKIEYRNANSVFYKTEKAGRDSSKARTRLDAVKDEMAKRGIAPTGRVSTALDAKGVADLIKSGKLSVDDIQKFLDAATQQ